MAMLDYLQQYKFKDMIEYIGTPEVFIGDQRSDHFSGMLTIDSFYIALFHLTEHHLLDELTYDQNIGVLNYIAGEVRHVQERSARIKGSHAGIFANITKQIVARGYHSKYCFEFKHSRTSGDYVLFRKISDRISDGNVLYLVVDSKGQVMTYNHFKAIQ